MFAENSLFFIKANITSSSMMNINRKMSVTSVRTKILQCK